MVSKSRLKSRDGKLAWRRGNWSVDQRPDTVLCVHHRYSRHVHDVLNIRTLFQDVDWLGHTHQNRADRRRTAQVMQQLIGDVAGTQVREYQHVGWLFQIGR